MKYFIQFLLAYWLMSWLIVRIFFMLMISRGILEDRSVFKKDNKTGVCFLCVARYRENLSRPSKKQAFKKAFNNKMSITAYT